MLELAFVKTAIKLVKQFWWVAVLLALAGGVWWIIDTIDDAKQAQAEAEEVAVRAEARATAWKSAVDTQNASIQSMADSFVTLRKNMNKRDADFAEKWKRTNQLVSQSNTQADRLIAIPPAQTEEQAVVNAKAALKDTAGFGYLEIDHVAK